MKSPRRSRPEDRPRPEPECETSEGVAADRKLMPNTLAYHVPPSDLPLCPEGTRPREVGSRATCNSPPTRIGQTAPAGPASADRAGLTEASYTGTGLGEASYTGTGLSEASYNKAGAVRRHPPRCGWGRRPRKVVAYPRQCTGLDEASYTGTGLAEASYNEPGNRPLNVSSATPLLSRCPRPSATTRSYWSLVAPASGSCRPASAPSAHAIPESFAAWAAEK